MNADGQRQSACWRCAYFDRDPGETEEGGYCRRYPPTTEGLHAMWPGVEYLDWCGEFEELYADRMRELGIEVDG